MVRSFMTCSGFIESYVFAEELQAREEFNTIHGPFLPEDVCLYIQTAPSRWVIKRSNEDSGEVLPIVAQDLLEEVCCLFSSTVIIYTELA